MIEMFMDILTRILKNQGIIMHVLRNGEEDRTELGVLKDGITGTIALLMAMENYRNSPKENEEKPDNVTDLKDFL